MTDREISWCTPSAIPTDIGDTGDFYDAITTGRGDYRAIVLSVFPKNIQERFYTLYGQSIFEMDVDFIDTEQAFLNRGKDIKDYNFVKSENFYDLWESASGDKVIISHVDDDNEPHSIESVALLFFEPLTSNFKCDLFNIGNVVIHFHPDKFGVQLK